MTPVPYWQGDGITIYHGDNRDVMPSIGAHSIVTDPPYGLGGIIKTSNKAGAEWGKLWSERIDWDREAPPHLLGIVEQAAEAIVWGGNYFALPPSRGWLVWDKVVREFSSGHCELAWTSLDQPVRAFNYCNGSLASEGKIHPTQKPLPLMRWCLGFLAADSLIVDPFMGSGTTLVAARDMGMRAIGIELEERYCAAAVKRLRQRLLFGVAT